MDVVMIGRMFVMDCCRLAVSSKFATFWWKQISLQEDDSVQIVTKRELLPISR